MAKIRMPNPIAELDGDEMTRILWRQIKDILLLPFVELNTEYYDLSLPHRDETDDEVTLEAAKAIRRLKVGVKCATITPNTGRMTEYNLKRMYKSRFPHSHTRSRHKARDTALGSSDHGGPPRLRGYLQGGGNARGG